MGPGDREQREDPDAGRPIEVLRIEPLLTVLLAHEVEFVIIGGFCVFPSTT